MPRKPAHLCLLLCLLTLAGPAAAGARLTHAQALIARARTVAAATGTVTARSGSWLTIQPNGRRIGVINALIATADALTRANFNYVWGGGHPQAGTPTRSGRKLGFDCSGAVAAVLAGAGLWPAGSPVPADNDLVTQLRQEGLLARGPGQPPYDVTLYDKPGHHIFMSIDGRFFGTSDGAGSGVSHGGPGWLYDGAPDARSRAFRQWHLVQAALRNRTTYGNPLTFTTGDGSLFSGVLLGDRVTVSYAASGNGTLVATGVTFPGAVSVSGTVTGANRSWVSLQTTGGQTLGLTLGAGVPEPPRVGDTVTVLYTARGTQFIARQLTVTGNATTPPSPVAGNAS